MQGLVDCDTVEEFSVKYENMKVYWPTEFVSWLESTKGRTRSLVDTMKMCMIKSVRKAAGLGDPPNKWVNNLCESMNNVLKEEMDNNALDVVDFLEKV